jgi:hypothetical protein
VSPLTLPLALLRDSAIFQRASSNKSSASEAPSTPGAAAAGAGSSSAALGDSSSQHHTQGAVGSGGGSTAGQPMTRKLLFEMFAAWCEEGTSRGGKENAQLHLRVCEQQCMALVLQFEVVLLAIVKRKSEANQCSCCLTCLLRTVRD